jgi:hypothetical protein
MWLTGRLRPDFTQAFADWRRRMMKTPPASDCAADAVEPNGEWNVSRAPNRAVGAHPSRQGTRAAKRLAFGPKSSSSTKTSIARTGLSSATFALDEALHHEPRLIFIRILTQPTFSHSLRPKRASIKAPREHREGPIAIIRSRHPGKPRC